VRKWIPSHTLASTTSWHAAFSESFIVRIRWRRRDSEATQPRDVYGAADRVSVTAAFSRVPMENEKVFVGSGDLGLNQTSQVVGGGAAAAILVMPRSRPSRLASVEAG
jgi:hypothetical protein